MTDVNEGQKPLLPYEEDKVVKKLYKNYKGEISLRKFVPIEMRFDVFNEWHGDYVWILHAFDIEKNEYRDFCFKDFL